MLPEKKEEIKKAWKKIESEFNDPTLFADHQKAKEVGQKRAELEKIVQKIESLEELEKQKQENEKIISSSGEADFVLLATEENLELDQKINLLEKEITDLSLPKDPRDEKNAIVEIRAGAGGDEAGLFASELFRMYSRLAEKKRWKISLFNSHHNEMGGFKEVIFGVAGENVFAQMKYESGVHRVQRVPETEKMGRVHTSTVTVAVLAEVEETQLKIEAKDLRIDTFASSGPGGQSVNTTDSAIRIVHLPTGLIVSCQDEKSQHRNKDRAMEILRARLLEKKEEEEKQKAGQERRDQIGSGDRSEKIRTYNFPQDRVTDHRIKQSWSNLPGILEGNLEPILSTLQEEDNKLKMAQ